MRCSCSFGGSWRAPCRSRCRTGRGWGEPGPEEARISAAGAQIRHAAAPAGPAEATRELFERHAPALLRFCRRELGSREEAEDALQATFLNAFRALRRGVVPESERAWLYAIARNVCTERARARRRRGRIEIVTESERIEEVAVTAERRRDELLRLPDAIASMPERQREAIVLREWRGLSYGEIGDRLELSQSAVEALIFRARRTLAQGLEKPPLRQRIRKAFDLSWIAGALKGLGAGGAAVKGAAAVAVIVSAGSVAGGSPAVGPPATLDAPAPSPAAVVAAPVATGSTGLVAAPTSIVRHTRSASPSAAIAGIGVVIGETTSDAVSAAVAAAVAAAPPSAETSAGAAPRAAAGEVERAATRAVPRRPVVDSPDVPVAPVGVPGVQPPVAVPQVPDVSVPAVPTVDVPGVNAPVPSIPPVPPVPPVDLPPVPPLPSLPPIPG